MNPNQTRMISQGQVREQVRQKDAKLNTCSRKFF